MLLPLLVQLAVIIVAARLFAHAFRYLGQPGVVGEIVAGLVLGPSVLGRYFPEVHAAALVQSNLEIQKIAGMTAATILFAGGMILLARPILAAWARRAIARRDGELGLNDLAILLALIFGCAVITNRIGIFAVFGAFLLGAVLSGEHDFCAAVNRRLRDFVAAFFVPIFFTFSGLRTNINALDSGLLWALAALVTLAAILGKLGACGVAAWLCRYPAREAACIGALLSTRGLMALIVVNLGKDLGVIPDSVFCMLILMALVTTAMTTPLVIRWMRGTELEPYILQSKFITRQTHPVLPQGSAQTAG